MNAVAAKIELTSADKQQTAQCFSKAAKNYKQHARVQHATADKLFALLKGDNQHVLDLGAGPLLHHSELQHKAKKVLHIDLSHAMLQQGTTDSWRVCADMDSLPLLNDSLDAVFSNFAIQWSSAPLLLFKELHRACRPGASVVLSSVLEGSLKEVTQAWQALDTRCHVNQFLTLEQIKRFAEQAGFDIRLAKQICLKDEFDSAKDALRSIKHIGASHIQNSENKQVGLMGKERFNYLLNSYPLENDKAMVSYEVALLELIKP